MSEKSRIKELYDHFDELNYGFRPETREYQETARHRTDSLERLLEKIPPDLQVLLDNYMDMETSVVLMEFKEVYRQGVCFGVKLVSEAFVTNMNKAVTTEQEW
jgi:hypothetical protein